MIISSIRKSHFFLLINVFIHLRDYYLLVVCRRTEWSRSEITEESQECGPSGMTRFRWGDWKPHANAGAHNSKRENCWMRVMSLMFLLLWFSDDVVRVMSIRPRADMRRRPHLGIWYPAFTSCCFVLTARKTSQLTEFCAPRKNQ